LNAEYDAWGRDPSCDRPGAQVRRSGRALGYSLERR